MNKTLMDSLPKKNETLPKMDRDWKSIPGYKGRYSISMHGEVWNSKYKRHLIPANAGRYLIVILSNNCITKTFRVHTLVAQAFIGKRKKGMVINHKDGNRLNNHVENLEYITQKENVHHAINNNLHSNPPRDKNGRYTKAIRTLMMGEKDKEIK